MSDEENWDPTKTTFNIFSSAVKLITSIPTLIDWMISTVKISYLKNERHHKFTPDSLAWKWKIILKTAVIKIMATTQLAFWYIIVPLTKQYHTYILKWNLLWISCTLFTTGPSSTCPLFPHLLSYEGTTKQARNYFNQNIKGFIFLISHYTNLLFELCNRIFFWKMIYSCG